MSDSCDLSILLGNTLGGIDHNYNHICALYSRHSTDNTVALDLFFYLTLASKSCGIDKNISFCSR